MKRETNYLNKIPLHSVIAFSTRCNEETVTLQVQNKGLANKMAQALLNKPKTSFIHLDKFGSFVWLKIDGEKSIAEIAKDVDDFFGKEAYPLYERIAEFFRILESQKFITWKKDCITKN